MKKYIIIIIALLFSLSVTAQRKTVTDKLQVTKLKNAEVLKTDSKGNVVAGELPVRSAKEICEEEFIEDSSIQIPVEVISGVFSSDASFGDFFQKQIKIDKLFDGNTLLFPNKMKIRMKSDITFPLLTVDAISGNLPKEYGKTINAGEWTDISEYLINMSGGQVDFLALLKKSKENNSTVINIVAPLNTFTEGQDVELQFYQGEIVTTSICEKIAAVDKKIKTTKEHVEEVVVYSSLDEPGMYVYSDKLINSNNISFRAAYVNGVTDAEYVNKIKNREIEYWFTHDKPFQLVHYNSQVQQLYGEVLPAGKHNITEYIWDTQRLGFLENGKVSPMSVYYTDTEPYVQPKLMLEEVFSIEEKLKQGTVNIFKNSGEIIFKEEDAINVVGGKIVTRNIELKNGGFLLGQLYYDNQLRHNPLRNGLFVLPRGYGTGVDVGFIRANSDNENDNHMIGLGHLGLKYTDNRYSVGSNLTVSGEEFIYISGTDNAHFTLKHDALNLKFKDRIFRFDNSGISFQKENESPNAIIDSEGSILEIYTPKDILKLNATPLPTLTTEDRAIVLDNTDNILKFWTGTEWKHLW